MPELLPYEKYRSAVRYIMGFVSFVFIIVLVFIFPAISNLNQEHHLGVGKVLIFVVTTGSVYTVLFNLSLSLYENYLWKWHSKRHNYNGFWKMTIRYEFLERISNTDKKIELPYIFESVFRIEQSVFDLRFSEGFSAPNEVWRDKSLRLTETGINMSYQVDRTDKKQSDPLPAKMIGYESVEVLERDENEYPKHMKGRQYHAALPDTCLYRGSTEYSKISKFEYDRLLRELKRNQ